MLLSALVHDETRGRGHCILWRFEPSDGSWKTLYDESFDISTRHLGGSDSRSSALPATSIRLTPEIKNAGQIAEVLWESQDWLYRFELNEEDELTALPLASLSDWRFISWHRWKEVCIALAEDAGGHRCLLRAAQRSSENWESMTLPGNADLVSGFAIFDEFVYVTLDDARRGFELWALAAGDNPAEAGSWQTILGLGASRYLRNANVLELVSCTDGLYLAVGLKKTLPLDRSIAAFAPQDFELLRVYPGREGWDIVIGEPRFTFDGLKVPLSGRGPGFNERDRLRVGCLIDAVSGLHLGVEDDQMVQLWRLDETDQWQEVCHGAFLEYQRARLAAAYPTPHGILLVTECLDFGGHDSVELWMLPEEHR
jgi:hypothetical protein